jgi:hypothetical protein
MSSPSILLLVLGLTFYQAPQQSTKGQKPEESAKRNSTQRDERYKTAPTHQTQTVVIQNNQPPAYRQENEKAKTDGANNPSHDWVERLNAFSTLIIALFTVLLCVGVFYQVITARGSERAWVVLTEFKAPEHFKWLQIPESLTEIRAQLIFKNEGHTPALLRNMYARFHIVDNVKELAAIPFYISKGMEQHPAIPRYGRILVPRETLDTTLGYDGDDDGTTLREKLQPIIDGTRTIVLYGIVTYTDAFDRSHESRFCYVWNAKRDRNQMPGGFRLGGPAEYNKAT